MSCRIFSILEGYRKEKKSALAWRTDSGVVTRLILSSTFAETRVECSSCLCHKPADEIPLFSYLFCVKVIFPHFLLFMLRKKRPAGSFPCTVLVPESFFPSGNKSLLHAALFYSVGYCSGSRATRQVASHRTLKIKLRLLILRLAFLSIRESLFRCKPAIVLQCSQ